MGCIPDKRRAAPYVHMLLGHNSLQMTMDLYCHVRENTAKDEMAKKAFEDYILEILHFLGGR